MTDSLPPPNAAPDGPAPDGPAPEAPAPAPSPVSTPAPPAAPGSPIVAFRGLRPAPSATRSRDERPGIAGLTPEELASWFTKRGEPAYRVRQVLDAVWRGRVTSFGEALTLPAALRTALEEVFRFDTVVDTETRQTDGGLTEKALHHLSDGLLVESVLMHYPARAGSRERHTLCISSQAGCAVGCPFCATGELGYERDLETAEIVDQVRHAARLLAADGRHLTNVVFMGMGEPLLNLDRVLEAIAALNDPQRFGIGARHITLSTSGVVPGIRRLTALGPQFTLAVSLHAARDALRDVLVPLNRRWPVAEVVEAAREHARATGRRVTYEVTMIDGINDTDADADALAALLRDEHAHVNLIPMNPVAHTPWQGTPLPAIERFAARLTAAGIATTIRFNRGTEIGAACGQLAAEHAGEPAPIVVQRRRDRLVAESAAALRGERSREPVPAGVGED
jgi:23S rRNA (adenine2503-C2)-methyltransferase